MEIVGIILTRSRTQVNPFLHFVGSQVLFPLRGIRTQLCLLAVVSHRWSLYKSVNLGIETGQDQGGLRSTLVTRWLSLQVSAPGT